MREKKITSRIIHILLLHLSNQLMDFGYRLFVLFRDIVDTVKQNHLHMYHRLHEYFVVAERENKYIKYRKYFVRIVESL